MTVLGGARLAGMSSIAVSAVAELGPPIILPLVVRLPIVVLCWNNKKY